MPVKTIRSSTLLCYNKGIIDPPLYFYRDKEMHEIDLLIEDAGTLYPLEMKKHADPTKKDVKAFELLDKIPNIKRGVRRSHLPV